MQINYTNIKCREIVLVHATENLYTWIILCDLVLKLWYIATSGPFCKDVRNTVYTRLSLSATYIIIKLINLHSMLIRSAIDIGALNCWQNVNLGEITISEITIRSNSVSLTFAQFIVTLALVQGLL